LCKARNDEFVKMAELILKKQSKNPNQNKQKTKPKQKKTPNNQDYVFKNNTPDNLQTK